MKHFTTKTRLARAAMTLLVALLSSVTGAWAEETTLTVYDGTDRKEYVPFYSLYADYGTRCQFIIPDEEISVMAGGSISALTFYSSSSSVSYDEEFTVYLKEVEYTTFATAALEDWDSMDDVYTGTLTISENQLVIRFSSPYSYQGGNLMIGFQITTWGSSCPNNIYWYGKNQESVTALYNNANKSHDWSSTYSEVKFIPMTTFTYTPGSGVVYKKPTNLTVSDLTSNGATISWTAPANGSPTRYAYQYKKATDTEWSEATTTATSVSISGLAAATAYEFHVKAVYSGGESGFVSTDFTTDCAAITVTQSASYTENFNSYTAATNVAYTSDYPNVDMPLCWSFLNLSGNKDEYPQVFISSYSSYAVSGNCLFFKSSKDTPIYAVLPTFDNDISGLQLDFTYRNEGTGTSNGTLYAGYMTDPNDASTFVVVYPCPQTTTKTTVTDVSFTDAPAGSYIAFKYEGGSSDNCYLSIDDVNVRLASACMKPTDPAVSDITSNSAVVSWDSDNDHFNIKLGDDIIENITTNPYTLTSLNPATSYTVQVQSVCGGGGLSSWSDVASFTTAACIPLTEAFGTDTPTGWGRYSGLLSDVMSGTVWGYDTGWNFGKNAGVFDEHARINIYGTSCKRWLVTPTLLMENNVQLLFELAYTKYVQSGTGGNPDQNGDDDKFVVLIQTESGWEILRQWDNAGSEYVLNNLTPTPITVAFDLSSYAGQNIAIAFYAESTVSNADNNLHIDNVSIDYIPNCAKPTSVAASNVTAHEATVTWTSEADAWEIQLNDEPPVEVTETTYAFENLAPETTYSIKVRTNCGSSYSEWANGSFTTGIACPAPSGLTVSDITSNSAVVSWKSDNDHFNIKIGDDIIEDITTNTYTLTSLNPVTSYTVQVQSVCGGDDGSSQWSEVASFTTMDPYAAPTNLQVTGITASSATLSWTPGYQETTWTVKYKKSSEDWEAAAQETVNGTPTLTLSGLNSLTTYNVQVYNGENYLSGTFTTVAGIPLLEEFATSSVPTGWSRYTGLLSNVQNGTSLTTTTSGWNFGTVNGVFNNHAKVNIYSNYDYWLVTPSLVMENNVQLTFDLALTQYNGTLKPVEAGQQADDKFVVLITTDNGTTWSILRQWDNAGSTYVYDDITCSATGEEVTINLSSYAGRSIAIAFYGESTVSGGDNNLHIDNVRIDYIPACPKPTDLTCTAKTATTATLSWTENGTATAWQLCLNNDEANPIEADRNPFTLMDLDPETTYSVKVRAIANGDTSQWTDLISFTTPELYPMPTDLACTATTATTATLSWTVNGEETAWQICLNDDEEHLIDADSNPFKLEELNAETIYTAKVRAVVGGERSRWSDPVTFEPTDKLAIGSGTGTSGYLPSNTNYDYSYTQQIYTVEELGEAGVIESIDFYMTSNTDYARNLDIYMVSTDKNAFENNSDWITVTDADKVFSGNVDFIAQSWTTITLDNAFIYDGTQNVAVIVDDNTGVYSSRSFRTFTATANQAHYFYQDNNDIPIDYSSSGTRTTSKNQIRILKSAMGDCMKPTRLAVTEVGPNFAKLSWTENGNATEWSVVYNGNTVTTNTNDNFILEGLDNETEYTVCVYPTCDESQQSRTITFTTLAANPVPFDVTVTEVTTNGAHVSWNGYSDSYSVKLGKVNDNIVLDENFDGNVVPADWSNDNTYPWTCATHGDGYCLQSGNAGVGNSTSAISVTVTYPAKGTISFNFWARGEGSSDTNDWDNCRFYIDDVQMFRYSTRTDWESYSTEVVAGTHTFKWEFKKDGSVNGTGDYFAIDNVVMSSSSINWGTPVSTTEKAYTFNDLTANSKYCVQVQGKNGDNTSEWSEVVGFTTMPEPVEIELANDATNNATTINSNDGVYANVTLTGRELYKDGYWNTLCLPFDIELDGSPLDGAEARELSSASISGTTLNLNFSEPVDELTAGTPYIIKWNVTETTAPLTENDLVFDGVMVYDTDKSFDNGENGDARVRFLGTYDKVTFPNEDKSVLFLGADNTLYYPDGTNGGVTIGACRAYFKIGEDGGAGARLLTGFNLNFGDETNAVFDLNNKEEIINNSWYSLDGVKLDGKPTKKGLYIHGGKKVVIK